VALDGAPGDGGVRTFAVETIREGGGRGSQRCRRVQRGTAGQAPDKFRPRDRLHRLHRPGPIAGARWHWRATEVYESNELVSAYHAREMAWCASSQLNAFRDCRFRFYHGIFPRCSLCPLFDAERAIRDVMGENPPPGMVLEIALGPSLQALLRGELPPHLAPGSDPGFEIPDFPPEEWEELTGAEPPD